MIGTIIFIILFIILIKKLFTDENNCIITYIIFSLLSPNLNIGTYQISFEILAFVPVFLILFIKQKKIFSIYKKSLSRQCLFIYLFIYIMASLISTVRYGNGINFISILATFRSICVIYMLQFVMREHPNSILDKIITPILFVNFATSIIQLTVPSSTAIFYELYYKDSMTPLKEILHLGYFNRAYGTFGTPVLLGIFAVFTFAIYIGFISEKEQIKFLYIKLIVSIILGLMSLSKTAILGIPLILLLYYLLAIFGVVKVKNIKILLIPFLIVPVGLIAVYYLEKQGTFILWYIEYLLKPFEAFTSRYDKYSGILTDTYLLIRDNLLIGVGAKLFDGVFTGDSMYVGLMYNTGILGTSLYFIILIVSSIRNIKYKHLTALLCAIAIILVGFAAPIQFDILSAPLLAYLYTESEK